MLRNDKFLLEVMDKIYTKLYQQSTPIGDWEKMKECGETKIERFFENYIVNQELCDTIIYEESKRHKLNKYDTQKIKNSVYLGCCPKFEI